MYKHEKELLQVQLDKEKAVLEELEQEYEAALDQIEEKIAVLQSDELTQSRIYQLQYQQALKSQTEAILEKFHADEYTTIQQYLSDSYSDGFIGTVYSLHKQGVPVMLPINKKAAVKAILTDSKIKGTLYAALGIGVNEMKKSIRQEITRGIASGLSYSDMVRNLHNATKAPMANARTIVRTEAGRVQEAACMDAMVEAKKKGADVLKQWCAVLDSETRHSHQKVDGELRELNEKFSNGLLYPKEPGGSAEEVINCRCTTQQRARWALDDEELERLKERAAYYKLDKTENFADFKAKYLKAAEQEEETTFWDLKGGEPVMDYKIALTNRFEEGNDTARAVYSKYVPKGGAVVGKPIGPAKHSAGKVYMDFADDAANIRGAGTTYFHEHGHLVDYRAGHASHSARFLEALKADIDTLYKSTGERKKRDAEYAIMKMLTGDEIRNKVHGVSDLVDGLTGGKTGGAWRHRKGYYKGYKIQEEAFAHMFEASFSTEKQALMKRFFPSAWEVFSKMMEGLL